VRFDAAFFGLCFFRFYCSCHGRANKSETEKETKAASKAQSKMLSASRTCGWTWMTGSGAARHLAKLFGHHAGAARPLAHLAQEPSTPGSTSFHFVYTAEICPSRTRTGCCGSAGARKGDVRVERHAEPEFHLPASASHRWMHRRDRRFRPRGARRGFFLRSEAIVRSSWSAAGRCASESMMSMLDAGGPLNPESKLSFGEGGAGTFSDGKLTCRSTGPEVRRVLELWPKFARSQPSPCRLRPAAPARGALRARCSHVSLPS